MTFAKKLTSLTLIAALSAGAAMAKGHDQSGTESPGANVGAETVGPAQTLGAALGNGKDNSGKERGNSANAGRQ